MVVYKIIITAPCMQSSIGLHVRLFSDLSRIRWDNLNLIQLIRSFNVAVH